MGVRASLTFFLALVACGAATAPRSETPPTPADPSPVPESPAPVAAPRGPAGCPDLTVDTTKRVLDGRKGPEVPPAMYRQMRWAAGHRAPVAADFFLAPNAAVDRVVAAEEREPGLVPTGFREELAKEPRSAALRLKMARCEVQWDDTRRRAGYDALVALLLGAPASEVEPIVEASLTDDMKTSHSTCGSEHPCDAKQSCDLQYGECFTPQRKAMAYFAASELDIEDALSRAIMKGADAKGGGPLSRELQLVWGQARVHKCGASICKFTLYAQSGGTRLVRWDLRDAGTVEEVKLSPERARAICQERMGQPSRAACLDSCKVLPVEEHASRCRFRCERECVY